MLKVLIRKMAPYNQVLHISEIVSQQKRLSPLLGVPVYNNIAKNSTSAQARVTSQPTIAKLPVPPLEKTLEKYLRSVKPFLNATELQVTQEIVREFGSDSGLGRKLQRLLEDRASRTDNWLADWWLKYAYLSYRLPVVVHSSPGIQLPHQSFERQEGHLTYATRFIQGALSFKKILDENRLLQETLGKDPLDMGQYYRIFRTCRIPGLPEDSAYFPEPNDCSRHIVVIHNNEFFNVTILDENMRALDENQLLSQLRFVVEESPRPTKTVGILTSENRDTWAKYHRLLSQDPYNRKLLDIIEKSLFVLCLDGPAPDLGVADKQSISGLQMVHGGGSRASGGNRWFDKALQLVVGSGGDVGCCYEHCSAEGGPVAYLLDYIYEYIGKHPQDLNYSLPTVTFPIPLKLEFKLTPEVEQGIETACKNLDKLVADFEMYCSTFPAFGKDVLKSFKVSPDSFIQMALQLAFYRLHKTPGAHYESAGLRKFIHGRTETIRSCSQESVDFAMKMLSGEEKYRALLAAIDYHKNYAIECVNGHGVDRHLLGLKLIAIENGLEVPALFKDPAYIRSTHFRISTSQIIWFGGRIHSYFSKLSEVSCELSVSTTKDKIEVPMRSDGVLSFGPVVPDGYGICYNPRNLNINFSISAFRSDPKTSAKKFQEALYKSLQDMHDVAARAQLKSKL
uniref:Choline/carnitine acyltransferase domain-containing protein n=3 Tax=Timema TaxID=61471 RepID=A0A7R9PIJ3_TIMGE|nr:unnamed protein product [Timema genevievae]